MTEKPIARVLLGPADVTLDEVLRSVRALSPMKPFDQRLIDFVARLSTRLLSAPEVREYPELAALGHWFRKARLIEFARQHATQSSDVVRVGRGLAFHVAPANVDSVFMYSWLLSLLSGNTNIVRVSQVATPQQDLLVRLLADLCADPALAEVAPRIVLLTYQHDREITQRLSEACDVRLVWGGDATVEEMRSIPIQPTAVDICFPDRFSLAAVNALSVIHATDHEIRALAEGFYNDAFWFGQQACSSPRMLVWVGTEDQSDTAQRIFWGAVRSEVERRKHENTPAMLMARLGAAFESAAGSTEAPPSPSPTDLSQYPLILKGGLHSLTELRRIHCGNGLFYQDRVSSLAELAAFLTNKDQTLAVSGFAREEVINFIDVLPARAIDRIARIGKALEFDAVWDGQNFFASLTRCISVTV